MVYIILALVVLIIGIVLLWKLGGKYEHKINLCIFIPTVCIALTLISFGTAENIEPKNEVKVLQELKELPDGNFIWEKEKDGILVYDVGNGPEKILREKAQVSEVNSYVHKIETYGDEYVIIVPIDSIRKIN